MSAPALAVQIQGEGDVSADNFNTYNQTCDNLAQLRAFVGIPGVGVFVRGFATPGDGGAGEFWWDETGTGPDDNLSLIVPPTAASGCWVRLSFTPYSSMFLPKQAVAPGATILGGTLYVAADGSLHYRGATTDTMIAPA